MDRPNLSKDYLAGTAPEDWIPLRSPQFYAEAGIELVTGETVTGIDPAGHLVHLEGGRRLGYATLLLATGAEPRRLPVPGGDLPHVHYLRTFEDSRAIIAALDKAGRTAVIGAGFIGLEVAASLRHRGIEVTVVAPGEIPLAHAVGETLGRFVADLHQEHGVIFRLGHGVKEIRPDTVVLDDGGDGKGVTGDPEPGNGLFGMRERVVALHQGTLYAGPGDDKGFLVRALLPIKD